jgi:hypothetical protein
MTTRANSKKQTFGSKQCTELRLTLITLAVMLQIATCILDLVPEFSKETTLGHIYTHER